MPSVLAPQQDSAPKQRHGAAIAQRVEDDSGPDPIAGFDAALRLRFVNQAAADIAGVPVAALIGLGVERFAELGWLGADIAVSAGVAFLASTLEPGDLFDRANSAVYDAKARGRGVVSVADMTEIAYASRRRDLAESLPDLPPPELCDARDVVTTARGALREWVHVLACSGGCVDLLDPQRVALALAHHLAPLLAMLQERAGSHVLQTEAKRVTCNA